MANLVITLQFIAIVVPFFSKRYKKNVDETRTFRRLFRYLMTADG